MTYSYSIYLGEHGGGEEALMPLITRLHRRGFFKGNYNFIRRNCNDFCEQFLELLGLPMPPKYVRAKRARRTWRADRKGHRKTLRTPPPELGCPCRTRKERVRPRP
jgi:hypothetical protein